MIPDIMQGWDNFFVAEAGAAAALAGLLFVAVSINLSRILEFPNLPARAAEALLSLLSVLVVSTFALVPGQSRRAYGLEIGLAALLTWAVQTILLRRTYRFDRKYSNLVARVAMNQLPPLTFGVAGLMLFAGNPDGVYWMVPATLMAFAAGIFSTWVLLVEIQR